MVLNNFEKKYQKVPIKIAIGIAIAIGFVFLFFFLPWGVTPPSVKKMRKTKPMAMAMLMPILIGTFWYFFSKWFGPV